VAVLVEGADADVVGLPGGEASQVDAVAVLELARRGPVGLDRGIAQGDLDAV
jgi:hypothetical protein